MVYWTSKLLWVVTGTLLLQQGFCQGQRQSPLTRNNNVLRRDLRLVHPQSQPNIDKINLKDNFSPMLPFCSQEVGFKRKSWVAPRHLVASNKKATKFEFVSTSLSCKYEMFTANLPLGVPISSRHSRSSYFSEDGYLKHENQYYPPNEYCVSRLNENRIEVAICTTNCSHPTTPCIQKCCGMSQIYSFGYGDNPRGCVDLLPNQPTWFPTLYHDLDTKLTPQELGTLHPHIIHKFPTSFKFNCRFNKTTVFPHGKGISDFLSALTHKTFRNLEFRLRKDGWLLYPGEGGNVKGETQRVAKRIENYCVDGAQDYGESSEFSNLEQETVLFLCSGGVDEAFDSPPTTPTPHPTLSNSPEGNNQDEMTTTRPTPTSTFSTPPAPKRPTQIQHLSRFKDRIELDLSDTSSSSSVEIEIEDGVPINSLEMTPQKDNDDGNNPESEFIPALLKVSVQVPQSQTSPTGLLHNNLKDVPEIDLPPKDSDLNMSKFRPTSPPPGTMALPTCCNLDQDVNDGLTHHCRNKRLNDKPQGVSGVNNGSSYVEVEWLLPEYFSTRGKSSKFLLRSNPLKCGSGKFQFQGFIHSHEQTLSKTSGDKRHGLLADGYLKYDHEFYGPEQYCINGLSSRIIEILICKPDCSMWETPCIKKCCGMDEIYNLGLTSGNRGCQPLHPKESKFSPILYKSMTSPVTNEEMNQIQPHFVQKYPPSFQQSCFNKITLAFPYSQEVAEKLNPPVNSAERSGTTFKHLRFRFRKDGKLMYSYPESDDGTGFDAVFDRAEFCVDSIRDYGEKEYFKNNENQTILFICASEPHSAEK